MDTEIRSAAFIWLEDQTKIYGDVLPWNILSKGFVFQGQRIIPIGAAGIWKPAIMQYPLSITTSPESPYDDSFTKDGLLTYRYRGTNPFHRDNIGLREAIRLKKPLIYFHGVLKGKYLATWPVFVIRDNLEDLSFTIAVEDMAHYKFLPESEVAEDPATYFRRSYLTSNILIRLHQRSFRERVLQAYQDQCSLCHLKHRELLDAAHIIGDKEDNGEPIIQNGLSLCKIHHAAFDKNIIGIDPDYKIRVRKDILEETDGPMLRYGIQLLNDKSLVLPRNKKNWPDRERLEVRFDGFLKAC